MARHSVFIPWNPWRTAYMCSYGLRVYEVQALSSFLRWGTQIFLKNYESWTSFHCNNQLWYCCCSQDLALQMLLNRPGSMFVESLSKAKKFTDERYGSVPRVYIVCTEDLMMPASFQRWMIEQNGVKEVMEIPADHMPVFSTPTELCHSILELARKHA